MAVSQGSGGASRGKHGEVLALLGALAIRGRHIPGLSDGSAPAGEVVVANARKHVVASFPAAALLAARRRSWIGPAGDHGHLVLTAAGRDAFRRSRSRMAALRAATGGADASDAIATAPSVNPSESPVGWLASRRDASGRPMLSPAEAAAGERLRSDLFFAQLTPKVTMGYTGLPSSSDRGAAAAGLGRDMADTVVAARARVTAALRAVGPELSDILIDVCGHLRGLEDIAKAEGWPRRAARLLLQRALGALARHYGLEPEVRVEETIARRLRHWGAEGYRPSLARAPEDGGERGQGD